MDPLRILVVDDVEQFAELIARNLRDLGHSVTCAPDGRAAADLLRGQTFDAVVTDIIMPVSDGFELIEETKKLQPHARILAMSGGGKLYNARACLEAAEHSGTHAVLQKPFSAQTLVDVLERLFPGKAAPSA